MLRLDGRVALVTGAGRGIGAAIAILFGRLGARVAINYRDDEGSALATARRVRDAGAEAVVIRADVSRPAEAERLMAETEAALGRLGHPGREPGDLEAGAHRGDDRGRMGRDAGGQPGRRLCPLPPRGPADAAPPPRA